MTHIATGRKPTCWAHGGFSQVVIRLAGPPVFGGYETLLR